MKASACLLSASTRVHLKIWCCTITSIGSISSVQAIQSNAFHKAKVEQTDKDSSKTGISCRITDHLITIRNTNTTIRLNDQFECEVYFQKGRKNYLLTEPEKRSAT